MNIWYDIWLPLLVGFAVLCAGAAIVVGAKAQPLPHEHGVTAVEWYDPECCNTKDCRPVPYDEVEDLGLGQWLHKPTGIVFKDEVLDDGEGGEFNRVRESQDGRFHVCFTGPHAMTPTWVGYCIYVIRTGV